MITICTAWKQAATGDEQQWAKDYIRLLGACFKSRGVYSPESFAMGLERLTFAGNPFLPTQGEFVDMCQPRATDYGLPDLESGFIQAQRIWLHKDLLIQDAHPVFHHMASQGIFHVYGFKQAKTGDMKGWKAEFNLALNQCMWHLQRGDELGEAPKALEHDRTIIQPTAEDIERTSKARTELMEKF